MKEILEKKVARGFRILERKEKYDPSRYMGPSEAAEVLFKEVLELDAQCYQALMGLGRCYYYRPYQFTDAITIFKNASLVCPRNAEPFYWIGLIFLHAGERGLALTENDPYDEAIRYFQIALKLGSSQQAWIANHIGTAYFRKGEWEEAIVWFSKSAEKLTTEEGWIPSTYFLAAEACEKIGRFRDAIRWYERYRNHRVSDDEAEIEQRIRNLRVLEENRKKAL